MSKDVLPQWVSQNPYPYSGYLNDIAFRNEQEGWIVGQDGVILKTSDGGILWEIASWDPEMSYYTIEFISEQAGFIGGYDRNKETGFLARTMDGGNSWTRDDTTFHNYYPRDIFFSSPETGWIGARDGVVYKTYDSGHTWDSISSLGSGTFWSSVSKMFFADALHGWALLRFEEGIQRTTDGGYTWQSHAAGNLNGMHFFDRGHGIAVGSVFTQGHYYGTLFQTFDGGQTWESEISGDQNIVYYDIVFKTAQRGWLVGDHGMIKHTNDGGATWSEQYELPDDLYIAYNKFSRICARPNGGLVAVGEPGLIGQTENDMDWEVNEPLTNRSVVSLFFLNDGTGWAGDSQYNIYSYKKPGQGWEHVYHHPYDGASDLFFVDELTGWYSSSYGKVFRSDDGGHHWSLQNEGSYLDDLFTIDFINSDNGWAAGENRMILHTSDGGLNWGYTGYQAPFKIQSIDFVSTSNGWAVGGQGGIIHTSNWGWGWDEQSSPTLAELYSVCFTDEETGWICGEFGKILFTSNGGETWTKQNSTTNEDLHSILFVDRLNGWAAGEGGTIVHTIDGGNNWYREASTTEEDLYVIHATDAENCWAGGELGTLLYANYEGWTGIDKPKASPSSAIHIYPNPFSDHFEIDIRFPGMRIVSLSLVDINGRVLNKMDIDVKSDAGTIVRADDLPPGVYFLLIESNEFREIRKVVRVHNAFSR